VHFPAHELGPCEFRKPAAFRTSSRKFRFDHVAVVEHQDAGRVPDGRKPVCDHECRPSPHHFVERRVTLAFGDRIERAGRLVEIRIGGSSAAPARLTAVAARRRRACGALAGTWVSNFFSLLLDEFQRLGHAPPRCAFLFGRIWLADAQLSAIEG